LSKREKEEKKEKKERIPSWYKVGNQRAGVEITLHLAVGVKKIHTVERDGLGEREQRHIIPAELAVVLDSNYKLHGGVGVIFNE